MTDSYTAADIKIASDEEVLVAVFDFIWRRNQL